MRSILSISLVLILPCFAAPDALAPSPSNLLPKTHGPIDGPVYDGNFTQGDTIENPFVIPVLPFYETGNNCGFGDDYEESCPYGSSSPDVVYRLDADYSAHVRIDLCESSYDTKVFVYDFEAGYGFSNPLGCNDDAGCGYSGYQSRLDLFFVAGHTYYIVVDGYGGDCGDYVLMVTLPIFEILECPGNAQLENEEDCYDGYVDSYNGGCNSELPAFQTLTGSIEGIPFDVCGTSGTFVNDNQNYRDTDWYELVVTEESTITFQCKAEFPLLIFMIDGNSGCDDPLILDSAMADIFPDEASLTHTLAPGVYWFWVGPQDFSGVECGSLYVMTVAGYGSGSTPATETTWGAIKSVFR